MDKGGAKADRGYPGPTRGMHSQECTNPRREKPAFSAKRRRGRDAGKPDVVSIVCTAGHYSGENSAWLTYAAAVMLCSV